MTASCRSIGTSLQPRRKSLRDPAHAVPRRQQLAFGCVSVVPAEAPPPARAHEAGEAGQEVAALVGIGVPEQLALAAHACDDERLGAAELLDAVLAVAIADAGLLPAPHRDVVGE